MFLAGTSDISLCKPIITLNAIKQKNIDINLALFLRFAAISLWFLFHSQSTFVFNSIINSEMQFLHSKSQEMFWKRNFIRSCIKIPYLEYLAPIRFIFYRKRTSIVIWDLRGSEKWKHSCPILLSSGRMRLKKPKLFKTSLLLLVSIYNILYFEQNFTSVYYL